MPESMMDKLWFSEKVKYRQGQQSIAGKPWPSVIPVLSGRGRR